MPDQITPITQDQISAATNLFESLVLWRSTERALLQLREKLPEWTVESSLLKCVAINSLYSTQVFAIDRMALHAEDVLKKSDDLRSLELVERIAAPAVEQGQTMRRFVSFASKLCHFFVNDETFPIYDSAARDTLRRHLGKSYVVDYAQPYLAFCKSFDRLKRGSPVVASTREIDRYLWLASLYCGWRNNPGAPIHRMLRPVFERGDPNLKRLLPRCDDQSFPCTP